MCYHSAEALLQFSILELWFFQLANTFFLCLIVLYHLFKWLSILIFKFLRFVLITYLLTCDCILSLVRVIVNNFLKLFSIFFKKFFNSTFAAKPNICSSVCCSDSPELVLSNVCSSYKYTIILYYYGMFHRTNVRLGVFKTKTVPCIFRNPYSWFIHTLT